MAWRPRCTRETCRSPIAWPALCGPATVGVNAYSEGDLSTPFGGYKQSGFGGHDKSVHAHDQYTELKTIWIDMAEPEA